MSEASVLRKVSFKNERYCQINSELEKLHPSTPSALHLLGRITDNSSVVGPWLAHLSFSGKGS